MEPLSPVSIPHHSLQTRGRSTVPKHPRSALPPLSPSFASSSHRPESPDLIFPMSPVMGDSKETPSTFSPRRVLPIQQTRRATEPILIDLVLSQPKLPHPSQKENTHPKSRSKPTVARATPSASQKSRRHASSGVTKRLMEFLNPTPSVMATPTAVTVRRSSQADGLSAFVMEEHTTPPLSDRPVSKPVQIKRSSFDPEQEQFSASSLNFNAHTDLLKMALDRAVSSNHELRGANETTARPRPRINLKKFSSHAQLRTSQQTHHI